MGYILKDSVSANKFRVVYFTDVFYFVSDMSNLINYNFKKLINLINSKLQQVKIDNAFIEDLIGQEFFKAPVSRASIVAVDMRDLILKDRKLFDYFKTDRKINR